MLNPRPDLHASNHQPGPALEANCPMRRLLAPLLMLAALTLLLGIAGVSLFATAAAGGLRGGHADWLQVPSAGAQVSSEPVDVGPFTRLEVIGGGELVLLQGDREAVVVEGPAKGEARVRVKAGDGVLQLVIPEGRRWWGGSSSRNRPVVTVHFRQLSSITLSGTFSVTAAGLRGTELEVTSRGAGTLALSGLELDALRFASAGALEAELTGRATRQEVSLSGAGDYEAGGLKSEWVKVSVSGAGSAVVHATRELDARISGVGEVAYYGNPEVKRRVSGLGEISRRGDAP